MSVCNAGIKIHPSWILFFDQTDFPLTSPFLDLLFARDGSQRVVVYFKPDELVDGVSLRKTFDRFDPVLISAPQDIVGHAKIERAVLSARKKIDVIRHRASVVMDSGLAPSGAPRNDARTNDKNTA